MGPRRTTLTYSSENAAPLGEAPVFVYYCKHSGRHVMTTDCDLSAAPRRATDHALVIDTSSHTLKLYNTQDGGEKLIRRRCGAGDGAPAWWSPSAGAGPRSRVLAGKPLPSFRARCADPAPWNPCRSGDVERQYRVRTGPLPIAYYTEPGGRYLYVLDDALTTYTASREPGKAPPVPPCIRPAPGGATLVVLEVDDRAKGLGLLRISADAVRLQMRAAIVAEGAMEELLGYLRQVLGAWHGRCNPPAGHAWASRPACVGGVGGVGGKGRGVHLDRGVGWGQRGTEHPGWGGRTVLVKERRELQHDRKIAPEGGVLFPQNVTAEPGKPLCCTTRRRDASVGAVFGKGRSHATACAQGGGPLPQGGVCPVECGAGDCPCRGCRGRRGHAPAPPTLLTVHPSSGCMLGRPHPDAPLAVCEPAVGQATSVPGSFFGRCVHTARQHRNKRSRGRGPRAGANACTGGLGPRQVRHGCEPARSQDCYHPSPASSSSSSPCGSLARRRM